MSGMYFAPFIFLHTLIETQSSLMSCLIHFNYIYMHQQLKCLIILQVCLIALHLKYL